MPASSNPLLVGIDLGTTHSALAFAERRPDARPQLLPLPQLVSGAEVEARPLLPSFLYAPTAEEAARLPADPGLYDAPWLAGEHARRRGLEAPERVVASAKSWLCHRGVDRHAPILPWVGRASRDESLPSLSPVEASARLLWHIRRAWDAAHPGRPLGEQEVVLTIPASFDETARELTVEAARDAGIEPRLLEEPQAAFYDFMAQTSPEALRELAGGPGGEGRVLVCDVGGGTTDLSLLRLRTEGKGVEIERIAVGDHLLLGGDNMDLALAHRCEPAIAGGSGGLDPLRFGRLVAACRAAKERLLAEDAPAEATVTVLGSGSGLVGGAKSTKLTRDEVEALLLDGFFPLVSQGERPGTTRGALVAFGLPYARDTAITRHLAAFLARHGVGSGPLAVLPNGGAFRAARLVERLETALTSWLGAPVRRLPNDAPDVAVARGAVAFALARAGFGRRITGGSARAYYVGVGAGSGEQALCVVPRGAEPGEPFEAPQRFVLKVGSPSRFPLFASRGAEAHRPGDLATPDDERFDRLPSLSTTLPGEGGAELPVVVRGELSEVGTLELACVEAEPSPGASPRRFGLSFGLREGARPTPPPPSGTARPSSLRNFDEASALLDRVFGKKGPAASPREVKDLTRDLERLLGERSTWSTALARSLVDLLLPSARARKRSPDHERAFWSLAGYGLRPGFGAEGDPARIAKLAPLFAESVTHREARVWQQFWVAFRRIAGGLDEAAQTFIREYADPFLLAHLGASAGKRPKGPAPEALDDLLSLASFLERVAPARKTSLGRAILERTWTKRDMRLWDALGRLGARAPTYASAHYVVPPATAEEWVDQLLREPWAELPGVSAHAARLARRTGDRARDLSERARQALVRRMQSVGAAEADLKAVREIVALDAAERALSFGESLPVGLRLEAADERTNLPMGMLVQGEWKDVWYDTAATKGAFDRKPATFREKVSDEPGARFQPEAGRYHLYVSYACPWASRALVVRSLKGLQRAIDVTVVDPFMGEQGWAFSRDEPEPLYGLRYLYELYTKADPKFTGRVTVPVLWCKREQAIVNNESSEIIRMLNGVFNAFAEQPELDLYPEPLRPEIDRWNDRIYPSVNNGVYRAGFATTQAAYDEAVRELFDALDELEAHLAKHRYLVGDRPTEADWRLFTTLVRFDWVYHGHFKCNVKRLVEYPHLFAYTRELYQQPGVAATVHERHIKEHYYRSHPTINPTRIVPAGPRVDFGAPHGRG